jgi:chaperone modulatory protein CbpM
MSRESHSLTGEIVEEYAVLDVQQLSRLCRVETTFIVELVEEGVLTVSPAEPRATAAPEWRFPGAALRRVRLAARLQRDLEVNLPGVALALQLLEELEAVRRQLEAGRS